MNSDQNQLGSKRDKGFALITALLIIMIISAIAASMVYTTMTEGKLGGSDLVVNQAQYAAEAEMENLTSALDGLYSTTFSPTKSDVDALTGSANWPNPNDFPGVTYNNTVTYPGCANPTQLCSTQVTLNSGADAGLSATIVPLQLNVTAIMPTGATVSISRYVDVALIPVFQFGAFAQNDLTFESTPAMNMAGNVHTNGNLWLGDNVALTFFGTVSAYGDIHRDYLPNGVATSTVLTGSVQVPTVAGGCGTDPGTTAVTATATCRALLNGTGDLGGNPEGSRYGGVPGTINGRWGSGTTYLSGTNAAASIYKEMLESGATGGENLQLQFVGSGVLPAEIIRVAKSTDNSALQQSRMYNLATIRVLLADTEAQLPCNTANLGSAATCATGDPDNVPIGASLGSGGGAGSSGTIGWVVSSVGGNLCSSAACGANASYSNVGGSGTPYSQGSGSLAWSTTFWATGVAQFAGSGQAIGSTGSVGSTWACCAPGYGSGGSAAAATTAGSVAYGFGTAAGSGVGVDIDWQAVAGGSTGPRGTLGGDMNPGSSKAAAWVPYDNYFTAGCTTVGQGCAAVPQSTPSGSAAVVVPPSTTIRTYTWPLIKGWLRVEVAVVGGGGDTWTGVTRQWLSRGFARGPEAPCSSNAVVGSVACGSGTNPVHPNAIILLQELADHNNNGVQATTYYNGSMNQYNWFPINFFDPREGELRNLTDDQTPCSYGNESYSCAGSGTTTAAAIQATQWSNSCGVNGIMNAVEIDVANLQAWINSYNGGSAGSCGASGQLDCISQGGYVLYFADLRDRTSTDNTADLEDIVNPSTGSTNATPNNTMDTGENPDGGSGTPNMSGAQFMGVGFGYPSSSGSTIGLPVWQDRTSCEEIGRKYRVTGPRHVLRLVNGGIGNLPYTSTGGGFTVAAWNPVYVWGNYNAGSAGWGPSTCPGDAVHNLTPGGTWTSSCAVPASIMGDAVSTLSASYTDFGNLNNPDFYYGTFGTSRAATNTYYNFAVATGVNEAYPTISGGFDGTDGGAANWLRAMEDWSSASYNYLGSIVSFYYATYATGIYKSATSANCPGANCVSTSVYAPAQTRNYAFNVNFANPNYMPPATPRFKNVNNVGFAQSYTPN